MKKSDMIKELDNFMKEDPFSDAYSIMKFLDSKGITGPDYKDRRSDSLRSAYENDIKKDENGKYVLTKGWEAE